VSSLFSDKSYDAVVLNPEEYLLFSDYEEPQQDEGAYYEDRLYATGEAAAVVDGRS